MSGYRFYFSKQFLVFSLVFIIFPILSFAQSSANEITLEQEIENLTKQLEKTGSTEKQLQLLEKIARSQEFSNMFPEAESSYFACAELASAEQKVPYILKAVRCSLSYGNTEKADELLAKIANGARSNEYTSTFKLYAIWSWLSKCSSYDETYEPIAVLKSYLELDSMKAVRPQMLFTLWFITGQIQYASALKKDFPQSAEYAVICGRAELAPSPFWFFAARKLPNLTELAELTKDTKTQIATSQSAKSFEKQVSKSPVYEVNPDSHRSVAESTKISDSTTSGTTSGATSTGKTTSSTTSGGKSIIKYYQLGFFSKIENAQDLVNRTRVKNIQSEIREEVRASGNKYYAVIVPTSDEKMGTIIKNSGFECYPVY